MRLKIVYIKNLRMSQGKISAQCCHAAIGLKITDPMITIVVLAYSDRKYSLLIRDLTNKERNHYRVYDAGYTEISPNTETCVAFLEK